MHDDLQAAAHDRRLQIAIDGPAGAGKSTVGFGIANSLSCTYVDTGLMYRAVTWQAQEQGVSLADGEALAAVATRLHFDFAGRLGERFLIDGLEPGPLLRSPEIDANVSTVSAHPELRAVLVSRQRDLAAQGCTVMVGRDIGTVVLPAALKFWITASPEERVRRRLNERADSQHAGSSADLTEQLRERDRCDSSRPVSPLRPADDALALVTDNQSAEQVIGAAMDIISRYLAAGVCSSHSAQER